MSGADEAVRHLFERVRRGFLAATKFARALAGDVAKRAPDCSEAGPADLKRDLGDGQVRVAKERGGPFDSAREQVPMGRNAESIFERSREVGRGGATHARQPGHGPLLVRRGVQPVFRAQQAAQQLRVTTWSSVCHDSPRHFCVFCLTA